MCTNLRIFVSFVRMINFRIKCQNCPYVRLKRGKNVEIFPFPDHLIFSTIGYLLSLDTYFIFRTVYMSDKKKGKTYIFFHFPTISNVRPSVIFCHCILISIPDLSINSDIKTEKKMFKCFHFPTIINVQIHQIMPRGGHSLKSMVMLKNKHPPPLIFQEFTPPAKVTPFHDIYVKKP